MKSDNQEFEEETFIHMGSRGGEDAVSHSEVVAGSGGKAAAAATHGMGGPTLMCSR